MATASPPLKTETTSGPKFVRFKSEGILSPRIVLNAREGFGKTSAAAFAPSPAILMAKGETGFATLRQNGRVPDCDAIELSSWSDVLSTVISIKNSDHQTIALDALGGFERLCHEHVCARDFKNEWGDKGFGSFQKGFDISCAEWIKLLAAIDEVRAVRPINTIILSHARIRPYKNPMGPDYDHFVADCHEKTWNLTHRWADAILFGNFVTVTEEDRKTKRIKAIGGTERVVFTTGTDAYDAKNRYGMPDRIDISDDPASTWATIYNAITGTKTADAAEVPEL